MPTTAPGLASVTTVLASVHTVIAAVRSVLLAVLAALPAIVILAAHRQACHAEDH
jgi:hypothetical protein